MIFKVHVMISSSRSLTSY